MKKLVLLKRYLSILFLVFLFSCKLSTDELADEVKISMNETWKEAGITGIKIESFMLTHKGGNEYSGILETDEDGESFTYSVDVIYDGENMQWEIAD